MFSRIESPLSSSLSLSLSLFFGGAAIGAKTLAKAAPQQPNQPLGAHKKRGEKRREERVRKESER